MGLLFTAGFILATLFGLFKFSSLIRLLKENPIEGVGAVKFSRAIWLELPADIYFCVLLTSLIYKINTAYQNLSKFIGRRFICNYLTNLNGVTKLVECCIRYRGIAVYRFWATAKF